MTSYERTNKDKKEIINQMEKPKKVNNFKNFFIKEIKKDIKALNILKSILLLFIFIFLIIIKDLTIRKLLKNPFFNGIQIIFAIIINEFLFKRKKVVTINKNIIIKLIIMMELFIVIFPSNKLILFELNLSKITLKLKGIGNNHILGYAPEVNCLFGRQYYPNEVYINGNKQDIVNYIYHFNQSDNIVELIWNNSINNCREMFRVCVTLILKGIRISFNYI